MVKTVKGLAASTTAVCNVFATGKKRSLVRMRIILAVFCASRPAGECVVSRQTVDRHMP